MAVLRRSTIVVLIVGVALLAAILMFGSGGGSQAASPAVANAATAHKGPQAKAKGHVTREQENSGENESAAEPAGEAQPGHEDPDGRNAQHECPPDCAPGELP